jgi:hypothetical protein
MEPKSILRAVRMIIWLPVLVLAVVSAPVHQGQPLLTSQVLPVQVDACLTCGGH